ncbi:MAG: hypothetical protein ACE5IY_21775, partial [bacterium]
VYPLILYYECFTLLLLTGAISGNSISPILAHLKNEYTRLFTITSLSPFLKTRDRRRTGAFNRDGKS